MALRLQSFGSTAASPPLLLIRFLSHQSPSHRGDGRGAQEEKEEALISSVVSILREQRSRTRWGTLRSLYDRRGFAFTPSQVAEVTLRIRSKPRLALGFFRWTEANALCRHDPQSYAAVIHILARSRLRSAALSIIQSAILAHEFDGFSGSDDKPPEIFETLVRTYRAYDSAPFVFDLVIRACLLSKRIDRALAIARMLRSRGISPEAATCNELIRVVSKARGSDAGFDLYKEMFASDEEVITRGGGGGARVLPKAQTFNTLLLSFHRDGRLQEKTGDIRAEMERFHCEPNRFTYCILMAGFCEKGMMSEATKTWEEMRTLRIAYDIVAYNTYISGFCNAGEMEKAEELFQEMVMEGVVEPTCATYEHLIRGHCRGANTNAAVLVYNDMYRKGFRPDVSTVEEMISELCERGRAAEGVKVLRNETRRGGFHPSRRCYEYLVKGLRADGKVDEAGRLQAEMVGKGFTPEGLQ